MNMLKTMKTIKTIRNTVPVLLALVIIVSGCKQTAPAAGQIVSPTPSVLASSAPVKVKQTNDSGLQTPQPSKLTPSTTQNKSTGVNITETGISSQPVPSSQSGNSPANDSTKTLSWYFIKQGKGIVPHFPPQTSQFKREQKVVWVGSGKKVYLSFDVGGPIVDPDLLFKTLAENHVIAAFFMAGYNMRMHPDLVKRLVDNGQIVGNHSMTHKDFTTLSDDQVKKELTDFASLFTKITGKEQIKLFRFPYGKYSMHDLDLISGLGYTTVFWSTAMVDWVPRKNGPIDPYNDIMNNLHDGDIILMHEGSDDNIKALDKIIKSIKEAGYEIAPLTELEVK